MKQVIAGLFGTTIVCIFIYSMNTSGGMEDPTELLITNITLGFFFLITFGCLVYGVHSIILNHKTKKLGKKGLAVLVNVEYTGSSVEDDAKDEVDYYDGIFLVLEETGQCNFYRLDVGTDGPNLALGEYYDVLYYKKNIILVEHLNKKDIPSEKLQVLDQAIMSSDSNYFG